MMNSPAAPGALSQAPSAQQLLEYLRQLDTWLAERRAELDALDAQILATNRQAELTADITLAMALWQAAKARQTQLLATWDSGRVGPAERDRLSALIWGRLDTATSEVASLQSMAVSLPEAGRLCDALVAQLRARLNTDPHTTALQLRLTDLRAQAERIRDQVALEPPAFAPAAQARLETINARIAALADKQSRGGDIAGSLSALEVEAAKFERDLIVGAARRRQGGELLAQVRARHATIAARLAHVHTMAEAAAAALWPQPEAAVPSADRLKAVANTIAGLTAQNQDLDRLEAELTATEAALADALAGPERAAAQLAALRLKAGDHLTDPAVAALVTQVEAQLTQRPVVMPVLQQLLGALSAEVSFRTQGAGR